MSGMNKATNLFRKPLLYFASLTLLVFSLAAIMLPQIADALSWSTPAKLGSGWRNYRQWLNNPALRAHPLTGEAFMIGQNASGFTDSISYDEMILIKSDAPGTMYDVNPGARPPFDARIAFKPSGEAYVAWINNPDTYGLRGYLVKLNSSGSVLFGKSLPRPFGGNSQYTQTDIAYSTATNRLYFIGQANKNFNNEAPALYFAESADEGDTFINTRELLSNRPNGDIRPRMCINKNNDNIHIVYNWGEERRVISRVNGTWLPSFSLGWPGVFSISAITCADDGYAYALVDNDGPYTYGRSFGLARFVPSGNSGAWQIVNRNVFNHESVGIAATTTPDGRLWIAMGVTNVGTRVAVSNDHGSNGSFVIDDLAIPHAKANYRVDIDYSAKRGRIYVIGTYMGENTAAEPSESFMAYVSVGSPPAAPSGLTASSNSTTGVTLNWTDNSPPTDPNTETGFIIEAANAPGGPFNEVGSVGANVMTFTHNGAFPGLQYYQVRAKNLYGNSDPSNVASGGTPPAAPSNLSANSLNSSTIRLTWTDNSGNEASFRIERSASPAGPFAEIGSVGPNVTAFLDDAEPHSTSYSYRVRARNSANLDSAYSGVATGATTSPNRLVFVAQPSGTEVDAIFGVQPQVAVVDSNGNLVPNFSGEVTLSLGNNPGGAMLQGAVTKSFVNGVAQYTGLQVNKVGVNYVLNATAAGVPNSGTSAAFNTTAVLTISGPAPTSPNAKTNFAVTVSVRRSDNSLVTNFDGPVTLELMPGMGVMGAALSRSGGTGCSGLLTCNEFSGGSFEFNNLQIDLIGAGYMLKASGPALTVAISPAFTVKGVVEITNPAGPIIEDNDFDVVATVKSVQGGQVVNYNGPVMLYLYEDPPGNDPLVPSTAELQGQVNANAINGLVTFRMISIDRAGTNFKLKADIPDLIHTDLLTNAFDVTGLAAQNCDLTQVNDTVDDMGDVASCRVTLRKAVEQAALAGAVNKVVHFKRDVFSGGQSMPNPITLGSELVVPQGVGIDAGCMGGQMVQINTTETNRIVLRGGNLVRGLKIVGYNMKLEAGRDAQNNPIPATGIMYGCLKQGANP